MNYGKSLLFSLSVCFMLLSGCPGDHPPLVSISEPVEGEVYNSSIVYLKFTVSGSSVMNCTFYCSGEPNLEENVPSHHEVTRTLLTENYSDFSTKCGAPAPDSTFTTSVVCTDSQGRKGDSGTVSFKWTKWIGNLFGPGPVINSGT